MKIYASPEMLACLSAPSYSPATGGAILQEQFFLFALFSFCFAEFILEIFFGGGIQVAGKNFYIYKKKVWGFI